MFDYVGVYQGRIQDLKLGMAQMDWQIWKSGSVAIVQIYFEHYLIYISNTIFYYNIVYLKPPIQYCD